MVADIERPPFSKSLDSPLQITIIFKNPRVKTQFKNLAKKVFTCKYKFLSWGFDDTTKLPLTYVLLKMILVTGNKFRACARIYNDVNYL